MHMRFILFILFYSSGLSVRIAIDPDPRASIVFVCAVIALTSCRLCVKRPLSSDSDDE